MRISRFIARFMRTKNLIIVFIILILFYWMKQFNGPDVTFMAQFVTNKNAKVRTYTKYDPYKLVTYPNRKDIFVPSSLKKIDWHNYSQLIHEKSRVGLGEQGKPAYLPKEDKKLEDEIYAENGFNGALSDRIPLNRSMGDLRHEGCQKRLYIESLPTVSIVVPFHNEHWSTLLRTAFSAQYRAPEHLIKEIFLVDDGSTKEFLKEELDAYLAEHMKKVKVLRLPKRSGLITARLLGAQQATADVIVFLDSHTECSTNWLPPLLEPIALDYRVVMCPYIDVIDFHTFAYRPQDNGARGAFDWEFYYKRLPLLPKDLANMPEPFESPVMAGGLFAISRVFFWELGGYDPGLQIWGGEQYEISFKIWQCGGRMLDAPCSRIGHIYRKFAPFPSITDRGDFLGKNYRRVAEVWMDEYAAYLYARKPEWRYIDPGDLTEQRAVRQRLKCKPFRWFMTQIAFDLPDHYPPVEPKPYAKGRVRPLLNQDVCVDGHGGAQGDRFTLTPCSGNDEQSFILSWHKDVKLKRRGSCWDVPYVDKRGAVLHYPCHLGGGNQQWRYHEDTKTLVHSSGHCLDHDPKTLELFVYTCFVRAKTQQWVIDTVNKDALEKWGERKPLTEPVEEWSK